MKKIEGLLCTVAQPSNILMVKDIIKGFEKFKLYYRSVCSINSNLSFREYNVLASDFEVFIFELGRNNNKFKAQDLAGFKRSLNLLKERYCEFNQGSYQCFNNFLEEAVLDLEKWIDNVIDEILSIER